MNSTPKYRAWDKKKEKMLYEEQITATGISHSLQDFFTKKHIVFMRAIRRKDADGKEIYEDDIIKDERTFRFLVRYDKLYLQWVLQGIDTAERIPFKKKVYDIRGDVMFLRN